MINGMEIAACQHMAVPAEVMQHIVNVESGYNPFAIGVVGAQLVRQPQNLGEAIATVQMLEAKGYNFSVGLSQVNRANFGKYGLSTYEQAFDICPNLSAGARILSDCYANSGNDWGKSFSCYYSGNFVTGYRDGYVQKVYASMRAANSPMVTHEAITAKPIELASVASASQLRGASAINSLATIVPDSPGYRMAIRSTVMDTEAKAAGNSNDPALVQAPVVDNTGGAAIQSKKETLPQSNAVVTSSSATPAPSMTAAATSDVFVPKITILGQPQSEQGATKARSPSDLNNASPPASTTNQADLGREVRDDAFVF